MIYNTNATKRFRSDVLSGTFGTVAAYGIGILLLPLITHFYKPEHIGMWQIVLALINLLIPLATLRFENAIVLESSKKITSYLLSVIVINTTVICLILLIGFLFIGTDGKQLFNLNITSNIIWMVIIGLIAQAIFLALSALIVKQKNFKAQAIAKILGAVAIPTFAITSLLFFNASTTTYIIAAISGIFMQAILLYKSADAEFFPHFRKWSHKKILYSIKKYKVYPIYMVPYALSQGVVWQITLISLGILFSTNIVGAYTVARQLVYMPVSLLTTGLKQVVFSYASSAPKYDKTVNNRIQHLLVNIINITIPFAVFCFFYISQIVNFALGEGWEKVGVFSQWILIPAVVLMLTSWLDRIFDVYGKQRLAVFLQVSSDMAFLLVFFACYLLKTEALIMVISLSLFLAAYNILWLLIVLLILGFSVSFWLSLVFRITAITIIFLSLIKLLEAWLPISLALTAELLLLSAAVYYTYTKTRINP